MNKSLMKYAAVEAGKQTGNCSLNNHVTFVMIYNAVSNRWSLR
jgi:hypothetical protein